MARSRPSRFACSAALVMALPSGAGEVLAGASVDLDAVALVHKERHLDDEARLQRGGLARAGDPVALHSGLGLRDSQFDGGGKINAHYLGAVHLDDRRVAFLQVI